MVSALRSAYKPAPVMINGIACAECSEREGPKVACRLGCTCTAHKQALGDVSKLESVEHRTSVSLQLASALPCLGWSPPLLPPPPQTPLAALKPVGHTRHLRFPGLPAHAGRFCRVVCRSMLPAADAATSRMQYESKGSQLQLVHIGLNGPSKS